MGKKTTMTQGQVDALAKKCKAAVPLAPAPLSPRARPHDPFYYVYCSDGSMCLYYTTKAGELAQVIMSADEVAACKASNTNVEFEAMCLLSDAFGEQKRLAEVEGVSRKLLEH